MKRGSENYFNCTIQELKQHSKRCKSYITNYFNCTIQELKREGSYICLISVDYFNCTIQELKRQRRLGLLCGRVRFQLYHTGIKTHRSGGGGGGGTLISIVPYRN